MKTSIFLNAIISDSLCSGIDQFPPLFVFLLNLSQGNTFFFLFLFFPSPFSSPPPVFFLSSFFPFPPFLLCLFLFYFLSPPPLFVIGPSGGQLALVMRKCQPFLIIDANSSIEQVKQITAVYSSHETNI